jgi:hypothetical protein
LEWSAKGRDLMEFAKIVYASLIYSCSDIVHVNKEIYLLEHFVFTDKDEFLLVGCVQLRLELKKM